MSKQISAESLQTLIENHPEVLELIQEVLDTKVTELNNLRTAFGGSQVRRARKAKPGAERVQRGLHGQMAIQILSKLGATSEDKGVNSAAIKDNGEHDFGSALNATLTGLVKKGIVASKNVGEGERPRYNFWLAMPTDAALKLAEESAKAGRKPKVEVAEAAAPEASETAEPEAEESNGKKARKGKK